MDLKRDKLYVVSSYTKSFRYLFMMALPLKTQSDCSSDSNHTNHNDSQDSMNQSDADIPHVHQSDADIPHVHQSDADIPHVHQSDADIPHVHQSDADIHHVHQSDTDIPRVDAHFGDPLVMDEIMYVALPVGELTGQVKWFNDRLGYGFCTVINDSVHKGRDIFVHHSGIRPLTSNYKTLRKGEYINFNVMNGHNGMQAVDVTGICGGPLMCDVVPVKTRVSESMYGSHHVNVL
jgi:CspA family cold shock protein